MYELSFVDSKHRRTASFFVFMEKINSPLMLRRKKGG